MPEKHNCRHNSGFDIPRNLYGEQTINAITKRANELKSGLALAGIGTLISEICETKARLETVECDLLVALQTNADLLIYHLQAVEQINNLIEGRTATAIDMPRPDEAAGNMQAES